ncbi:unnamed protein product [Sphenostylis stenocarpa]|uniref:Uncharacterized protein n=1 Tax=Sphenostylis stenocarpa TaxID=92480 RepID=A0AA86SDT3_9FABA|nr:unnamed protein product [Sphenostylis stenocarpa]
MERLLERSTQGSRSGEDPTVGFAITWRVCGECSLELPLAVSVRPTLSRVDVGVPELGLATTQSDSDLSTHDRHVSRRRFMDHPTSTCVFQDLGVRNKVGVNQRSLLLLVSSWEIPIN